MNYENFVKEMKEMVQKRIPAVKVDISSEVKNNNSLRTGLSIKKLDENNNTNALVIYLEDYFLMYRAGKTISYVADEIVRGYYSLSVEIKERIISIPFGDYEKIKDKITCRLINRRRNEELLKDVPYVPFLDLVIVFYIIIDITDCRIGSCLIRNQHLKIWKIDNSNFEEFASLAMKNTMKMFPAKFERLQDVIREMGGTDFRELVPMYVLSNNYKEHGAITILYDGYLKYVSDILKSDFYVIPSSIHETIIISTVCGHEKEMIDFWIKDINDKVLNPEEILSDRVYYYDREKEILL